MVLRRCNQMTTTQGKASNVPATALRGLKPGWRKTVARQAQGESKSEVKAVRGPRKRSARTARGPCEAVAKTAQAS